MNDYIKGIAEVTGYSEQVDGMLWDYYTHLKGTSPHLFSDRPFLSQPTSEQKLITSKFIDKWVKILSSTEDVSFEIARFWAERAYESVGRVPPNTFVFTQNPTESAMYTEGKEKIKQLSNTPPLWFANQDLMLNEMGSIFVDKFAIPVLELHKVCGHWFPFPDVCVIQNRPKLINIMDGMLHCETGPSIEYRGYGHENKYHLFGVEVPKWMAITPINEINIHQLLYSDQRLVGISRYGVNLLVRHPSINILDKRVRKVNGNTTIIHLISLNMSYPNVDSTSFVIGHLLLPKSGHGVNLCESVPKFCQTVDDTIKYLEKYDIQS